MTTYIDNPTSCPYYLISRVTLVTTTALRHGLEKAGIHHIRPAYLGALLSLWREDGLKVIELGRRAGLEASTMTGLLDRMERDGIVVRKPDPDDRRALRIFLTAEARRLKQPVLTVVESTLERLFQGIPEKKMAQVQESLRQVLTNSSKLSHP